MTLTGFVLLYIVATIAIGVIAATRVKNTSDFALAGRSLPLPMVITATFATWFGSETILGLPGRFIESGSWWVRFLLTNSISRTSLRLVTTIVIVTGAL